MPGSALYRTAARRRPVAAAAAFALGGAAVVAAARPASAQQIVTFEFGTSVDNLNGAPFDSNFTGLQYQQVYDASAFGGKPVLINQIAFSAFANATRTFDLTVGLGTTAATPSNPGTSFAANRRPDFTTVLSSSITATLTADSQYDLFLNLSAPFLYDPAQGNLLLDIFQSGVDGRQRFEASSLDSRIGRLIETSPGGSTDQDPGFGLRTLITGVAAPEPGSGLLSAALLTAVICRRRRRRAA